MSSMCISRFQCGAIQIKYVYVISANKRHASLNGD